MPDPIDVAVRQLADPKAGWVTRRDAAEFLGTVARKALGALHAHAKEADQDVRATVKAQLTAVNAPAPASTAPAPSKTRDRRQYSLDELAQACAKPDRRTVRKDGEGYIVEARLPNNRAQTIYLRPLISKDEKPLLRIYTCCGHPTPEALEWTLRSNARLTRCAFAIEEDEDGTFLILVHNLFLDCATPEEAKSIVKQIAFYGDWLEHKLTGQDEW